MIRTVLWDKGIEEANKYLEEKGLSPLAIWMNSAETKMMIICSASMRITLTPPNMPVLLKS